MPYIRSMKRGRLTLPPKLGEADSPFANPRATLEVFFEEVEQFQKSKKQADVMLKHIAKEALSRQQFTYGE